MSPTPTLRHRLEYVLFRLAAGVMSRLPYRTAVRLGRGIGHLLHLLDTRHRRVVRQNLRDASLGLDEAGVRRIAKACFAHFGAVSFGTLRLQQMSREELLSLVRFEGAEHWDAARSAGRGLLVLTGHYGHWEMISMAMPASGRPMAAIGRTLDNPLLDPYLKGIREQFGNRILPKSGAMRDSVKLLRQGWCLGFLLDQDALTNGIFVEFLGRWASTHTSAGALAIKYDLPVVPVFCIPQADDTFLMKVMPPLDLPRTGDSDRDVWTATQLMTWAIEAQIRQDPAYWFWMHRRFKTQPGQGSPLPAPLPPAEWLESLHREGGTARPLARPLRPPFDPHAAAGPSPDAASSPCHPGA